MTKRFLAALLAFFAVAGIRTADGWAAKDSSSSDPQADRAQGPSIPSAYSDGLFAGESPGWTGMKVLVQVEQGKIASVRVLQAKGSPRFYRSAVDLLPKRIVAKNSTDVDGVTGATLSSQSLKQAVRDALKKAE